MNSVRTGTKEKKPTLILGIPFLLFAAECGQQAAEDVQGDRTMPERTIEVVLKEHVDRVLM